MLVPNISLILAQYPISFSTNLEIKAFGEGLINSTYLVDSDINGVKYVLQKINVGVFENPEIIDKNINLVGEYLKKEYPDYPFIRPILNKQGNGLVQYENSYWRLTKFIADSYSINKVEKPDEAYQTGYAFGDFATKVSGMPIEGLKDTIPNFHNLDLRFNEFKKSIKNGNKERIKEAKREIDILVDFEWVNNDYLELKNSSEIPTRIMHHDAKINNVLFNKNSEKAICLCDLDTIMPGMVFSDLGDLIRTSVCEESEESENYDKVKVNLQFFNSLSKGFLGPLGDNLTHKEKQNLLFSGYFLIYMQALRFITDYFNDDIYYSIKHEKSNYYRAINQICLLNDYHDKRIELKAILSDNLNDQNHPELE